jgi:hypothetical protein
MGMFATQCKHDFFVLIDLGHLVLVCKCFTTLEPGTNLVYKIQDRRADNLLHFTR